MEIIQALIQNRQKYFWQGRKHEEDNNLLDAIESYLTYSAYLADKDKHIPHQWISWFYDKLGDTEKSLFHLEKFATGCTPPKAADIFKEIGDRYLSSNNIPKAIMNFEHAIEKNPNIGIRKKLDELKNGLL